MNVRTCPRSLTDAGRSTGRCCAWPDGALCGRPAPYAVLIDVLGLTEHLRCVECAAELRRQGGFLAMKSVR